MKCPSCQNDISLSKCAFCRTDLFRQINLQAQELKPEMILRNMIEIYGLELLQQEQRLSALISDLFAQDIKIEKLLLISIKEQVPQRIAEWIESDEREVKLKSLELQLHEDSFLHEDVSRQIVMFWRKAIEQEELDDSFEIVGQRGYCGFRNSKGKMITTFKYDKAGPFKEGLARVKLNGKWGFIDKKGQEIIPIQYNDTEYFSEGLACVEFKGNWGFIDKTGQEIIPFKYRSAHSFSEGLASVRSYDGMWRRITGQKISGSIGETGDEWGFIDKTGQEIIPFKYDFACDFNEGLACVMLELEKDRYGDHSIWGFIDKTGKEIIPLGYDYAFSFFEGLAKVKLNGKWGFIDKTGKEIIPIQYEDAFSFSEGLASVKFKGKWGYIDRTGNEIIPFQYDRVESFKYGEASVYSSDKRFWIDRFGNQIK